MTSEMICLIQDLTVKVHDLRREKDNFYNSYPDADNETCETEGNFERAYNRLIGRIDGIEACLRKLEKIADYKYDPQWIKDLIKN